METCTYYGWMSERKPADHGASIYMVDEAYQTILDKHERMLEKRQEKMITELKKTFSEEIKVFSQKLSALSQKVDSLMKKDIKDAIQVEIPGKGDVCKGSKGRDKKGNSGKVGA